MSFENIRKLKMTPTTSAVNWNISVKDNHNIERISLSFSAAPATREDIVITQVDAIDTDDNMIIRRFDPSGKTTVSFEEVFGITNGDHLNISYANTDGATIRAIAVVRL